MQDYFLRSERLGFREWAPGDLDLAFGLWGDPEVMRFIGGPYTREKAEARLQRELENAVTTGAQYWPVFLLGTGEHVGVCGLRPYDLDRRVFALGFHLRPKFWGQGYAPEASRAVIAYAFDRLGVSALHAGHHPQNEASRKVLCRLGFEYTHDELYPPTGLQHRNYRLSR
jgi:RimJ/RimL family protein N-acetyltransferase